MSSFLVLDTGELDNAYVGLTPTLVLDQGTLNTSGLSYNAYNSDLAYDSSFSTYDGIFKWTATARSNLQALSVQSSSTITRLLSAISDLGQLEASANEAILNYAHGSTQLDALYSQANATITKFATSTIQFGSLVSESNAEIDNFDNASAELGGLTASASYSIPTPPQPTPQLYGSSPYYKKIIKKQVKPQPEPIFKVEIEPYEPLPELFKTHFLKIDTNLSKSVNQAESIIEFSILEDEADLLLLV